jgi:hypothetical protein
MRDLGVKTRRKEPTKKTWKQEKDNIKMDVREIEWIGTNWINLPQDRGQ